MSKLHADHPRVRSLVSETGMGTLQAIRHLECRDLLARRVTHNDLRSGGRAQ